MIVERKKSKPDMNNVDYLTLLHEWKTKLLKERSDLIEETENLSKRIAALEGAMDALQTQIWAETGNQKETS